jgi:hypothetical protein
VTGFATILFTGRAWLLPSALCVVALAAALIWSGHRCAAERRVRIGCGLLKFTGILALAVCLLEPRWIGQRARPGANLFALIADNSQSLEIKDAGASVSRGELLRRRLTGDASGWQSALEENFQVRRYTFDSRLQNARDFSGLTLATPCGPPRNTGGANRSPGCCCSPTATPPTWPATWPRSTAARRSTRLSWVAMPACGISR